MKLGSPTQNKTLVRIVSARTGQPGEKNGKGKSVAGKQVYETVETFDVFDCKPEEVVAVVQKALTAASK